MLLWKNKHKRKNYWIVRKVFLRLSKEELKEVKLTGWKLRIYYLNLSYMHISPSVLSANFGNLNEDLLAIEEYVDRWHIDVMDGVFVPNLSFWYPVIKKLKTNKPLDIHLMMTRPEIVIEHLGWLKKKWMNIKNISTHVELWEEHVRDMMHLTTFFDIEYGVGINPHTDVQVLEDLVHDVDYVLIMWVVPWFSGQSFMAEVLEKAKILRSWRPDIELHLDGGVNWETIDAIRPYNFDLLVSGSFVFGAEDRKKAIDILKGEWLPE